VLGCQDFFHRYIGYMKALQRNYRKDFKAGEGKGREETYIAISGGFVQVLGNKAIVLADAAERSEEIDEQRAQDAVRRAQERLTDRTADMNLEVALAAMRRAQTRLRVVQRRRTRGQAGPPTPGI